MFKIHEIPADPGATQKRKRIGRGEGSGQGKTAGKGHKGMQARSGGGGKGPHFEGGQMPLIRRLPKLGFSNAKFRLKRAEIGLSDLNRFEDGAVVDPGVLNAMRLIPKQTEYVKILANGELTRKLTVRAHGFSAGARQAIEAAGGQCEVIGS